jgi:predicted DCC family thiol-disulfide oxidoreductase YuxK
VTAVPYQRPGAAWSAGLTLEECRAAAWAVKPDGRCYRGAEAMNVALSAAIGTSLPHIIYRLPAVRHLQDLAYAWVASNRHKLPGDRPYCSQHPELCRSENALGAPPSHPA